MKKFIVLIATVVMVASCMIVPALAADEYPPFPEGYDYYIVINVNGVYNLRCVNDTPPVYNHMGQVRFERHELYKLRDTADGQMWSRYQTTEGNTNPERIVFTSVDIKDEDGNVVIPATNSNVRVPIMAPLAEAYTEQATDIMREVIGVVVTAFPVLIGLLALRKGIAFLFQRIRGV